jgi:hypothetical protein
VKRWGTTAVVSVATLGLLATGVGRAAEVPSVSQYKFTAPVCAKDALESGANFQIGDVNNKGQFSAVIALGGERVYAWDGSKTVKVSEDDIALPDGSFFSTSNVWTSLGINDDGVVAWVADTDGSVAGVKYIVTYELATGKYNIIARPGDPADGGGTLNDGGSHGPSDRMLADINNKGQVVWNQPIAGVEGDLHSGIFMYDPVTKKTTAVARPGATVGGKKLTNAWWPMINDEGQVVFGGNLDDNEAYGVFVADGKGSITLIAGPDTKVGDVTIAAARWGNIANNGDVAFVGDLGAPQGGAGEATEDTAVFLYSAADKALRTVVKPGDALPGGSAWQGVEPSRRVVQVNSLGQVGFIGVRADGGDGVYLYDKAASKLDALVLGGQKVPGLGTVDGVSKGTGGLTGYHFGMSENGHIAFPAIVDGLECFVLATPPTPTAGG